MNEYNAFINVFINYFLLLLRVKNCNRAIGEEKETKRKRKNKNN